MSADVGDRGMLSRHPSFELSAMRKISRRAPLTRPEATGARVLAALVLAAGLVLASPGGALAQAPSLEAIAAAVVRIKTFINPEGRSVATLGAEREGSGIVIGADGLILTIGYLMLEAHAAEIVTNEARSVAAEVVGYDHETGFGLLKASAALNLRPIPFGKSHELKEKDPVLVASFGGPDMVGPAFVVAKREFAGSWEYLLEEAIFTAPPHPVWSGAALINREGKLVGVGSLVVGDAAGGTPGNMFVPIDRLPPIMADLLSEGRVQGPARPWLGLTTEEADGKLTVARVAPGGPAEKAGVQKGDIVVGVGGRTAAGLADFYRKVWSLGSAGTLVPLDVLQNHEKRRFELKSIDRMDHLRFKSTF
jgi:S1-C subfamily serine protease